MGETAKETEMYRTVFWTLWEREGAETAREGPKLEGWEMVALGGVMGNLDQRQDCLLALRRGDFG